MTPVRPVTNHPVTPDRLPAPTVCGRIRAAIWRLLRGEGGTRYSQRYRVACLLSVLPLRLDRIFQWFGTDKERPGDHSYGATYHRQFARYRYKRMSLLEIGVLDGASLLSWRAFFPRGRFVGSDILPKDKFSVGRISTYVADQSSRPDLAALCSQHGPFDIVIDDGSHQSGHQIFTFYEVFGALRDDGIYVIEDVQTSFWPGFFGGTAISAPEFAHTCVGEFLELSKYLNHNEFFSLDNLDERRLAFAKTIKSIAFEHNLIIVHKGSNDEPSNYERQARINGNWGWPA